MPRYERVVSLLVANLFDAPPPAILSRPKLIGFVHLVVHGVIIHEHIPSVHVLEMLYSSFPDSAGPYVARLACSVRVAVAEDVAQRSRRERVYLTREVNNLLIGEP